MTIIIRRGTSEDLFGAFVVFQLALHGLYQSVGQASPEEKPNPEDLLPAFDYFRTFTEYFTETADQFWVAEEAGEIIGFSRSMPMGRSAGKILAKNYRLLLVFRRAPIRSMQPRAVMTW